MKDFDKSFRRQQRFVHWFIGIVFVLIISFWIAMGVLVYNAATIAGDQDWSGGIKPVIESMWCGKPGCLNK